MHKFNLIVVGIIVVFGVLVQGAINDHSLEDPEVIVPSPITRRRARQTFNDEFEPLLPLPSASEVEEPLTASLATSVQSNDNMILDKIQGIASSKNAMIGTAVSAALGALSFYLAALYVGFEGNKYDLIREGSLSAVTEFWTFSFLFFQGLLQIFSGSPRTRQLILTNAEGLGILSFIAAGAASNTRIGADISKGVLGSFLARLAPTHFLTTRMMATSGLGSNEKYQLIKTILLYAGFAVLGSLVSSYALGNNNDPVIASIFGVFGLPESAAAFEEFIKKQ